MVHHRERLPLGLEAGDHLACESMPGLMSLSATLRRDRLGLLGHPDRAHAAFADRLEQLVSAHHATNGVRSAVVAIVIVRRRQWLARFRIRPCFGILPVWRLVQKLPQHERQLVNEPFVGGKLMLFQEAIDC